MRPGPTGQQRNTALQPAPRPAARHQRKNPHRSAQRDTKNGTCETGGLRGNSAEGRIPPEQRRNRADNPSRSTDGLGGQDGRSHRTRNLDRPRIAEPQTNLRPLSRVRTFQPKVSRCNQPHPRSTPTLSCLREMDAKPRQSPLSCRVSPVEREVRLFLQRKTFRRTERGHFQPPQNQRRIEDQKTPRVQEKTIFPHRHRQVRLRKIPNRIHTTRTHQIQCTRDFAGRTLGSSAKVHLGSRGNSSCWSETDRAIFEGLVSKAFNNKGFGQIGQGRQDHVDSERLPER